MLVRMWVVSDDPAGRRAEPKMDGLHGIAPQYVMNPREVGPLMLLPWLS